MEDCELLRGLMAVGFCVFTSSAGAGFYNGNEALDRCERDRSWCSTYVAGATDGIAFGANNAVPYCIPAGVTLGQMVDVYLGYLKDRPADRHLDAVYLVTDAMWSAWPCSAGQSTEPGL